MPIFRREQARQLTPEEKLSPEEQENLDSTFNGIVEKVTLLPGSELEREGIDKANPDAQGRFVAYLHEVMDQETLNSMARQSYGAAV